jgi:hypothetical protein
MSIANSVGGRRMIRRVGLLLAMLGAAVSAADAGGRTQGAIRTLAYVVTECRNDPDGLFSSGQRLMLRSGDQDPIAVMEMPQFPHGVARDLCRLYGEAGLGSYSKIIGAFQRLAVLRDGSGVVFEVTNDWSYMPWLSPEPPEEGFFFVRADGTGLRRLAAASRVQLVYSVPAPDLPLGQDFRTVPGGTAVSPDGRRIAFVDLGPDSDGRDAPQVVTLEVRGPRAGRRTQLTRLAGSAPFNPGFPAVCCPVFLDRRTIWFATLSPDLATIEAHTVRTDGTDLARQPGALRVPIARVIPEFGVVGGHARVVVLPLDAKTIGPSGFSVSGTPELFLIDGKRVLQLTNFGSPFTVGFLSGGRVFAVTPADPLGTNPRQYGQIFSLNPVGGALRQLTCFGTVGRSDPDCLPGGRACSVPNDFVARDPVTGSLVFVANCGLSGTSLTSQQLFTTRGDGTDLRQLTAFRGMELTPDGAVSVELPGPIAYSGDAYLR